MLHNTHINLSHFWMIYGFIGMESWMIPEHGREMHRNCGGATRWETMGNRSAAKHLSIIELEKVSTGGQC